MDKQQRVELANADKQQRVELANADKLQHVALMKDMQRGVLVIAKKC